MVSTARNAAQEPGEKIRVRRHHRWSSVLLTHGRPSTPRMPFDPKEGKPGRCATERLGVLRVGVPDRADRKTACCTQAWALVEQIANLSSSAAACSTASDAPSLCSPPPNCYANCCHKGFACDHMVITRRWSPIIADDDGFDYIADDRVGARRASR